LRQQRNGPARGFLWAPDGARFWRLVSITSPSQSCGRRTPRRRRPSRSPIYFSPCRTADPWSASGPADFPRGPSHPGHVDASVPVPGRPSIGAAGASLCILVEQRTTRHCRAERRPGRGDDITVAEASDAAWVASPAACGHGWRTVSCSGRWLTRHVGSRWRRTGYPARAAGTGWSPTQVARSCSPRQSIPRSSRLGAGPKRLAQPADRSRRCLERHRRWPVKLCPRTCPPWRAGTGACDGSEPGPGGQSEKPVVDPVVRSESWAAQLRVGRRPAGRPTTAEMLRSLWPLTQSGTKRPMAGDRPGWKAQWLADQGFASGGDGADTWGAGFEREVYLDLANPPVGRPGRSSPLTATRSLSWTLGVWHCGVVVRRVPVGSGGAHQARRVPTPRPRCSRH